VRILVFGAGAMGSFLGGVLARRHDVALVGRRDHIAAIREGGLRITGKTELVARPAAFEQADEVESADLVLVATKAYDTEAAMNDLRGFAETSVFLTLQNGLDNADVIARHAGKVLAGVTSHGVTFVKPGIVRHAGVGETIIGAYRGTADDDARRVAEAFLQVGLPTRVTPAVRCELWAKVVVNASINPLTALVRVPNGQLLALGPLEDLLEETAREVARVARAAGCALEDGEAVALVRDVAKATATNRSSMLQDIERRRPTEIDAIVGAVLREAARHGLDVPVCRTLHRLVQAAETVSVGTEGAKGLAGGSIRSKGI
jgi:2-dehydropantoate 2-reductase